MPRNNRPVRAPLIGLLIACASLLSAGPFPAAAQTAESPIAVGVARVDITPDYPVRLNGFGFRRTESEGVRQQIWAKALAFGTDAEHPAVVIAVDNLGVPDELTREVARRLESAGVAPERFAVTATHTHTAPMLKGCAPTIFGTPIPPEHQAHIDQYTRDFADKLEQAALAALKDRRPARLEWGVGSVRFAKNRRTPGGPVDHDLPLLVVRDLQGAIRALYFNYACHCVTLSDNRISGDWAGYAQEHLERQHPGATALASVGCGADQNPIPGVQGDKFEVASQQGAEIAAEVARLLKTPLRPVNGPLTAKLDRIDLAFDTHPTRAELEEKAKLATAPGYHARVQLERLDRGEALRTKISYPIQTWTFGDSLGMVFLAGEVVVDYSKRLKTELDGRRLWLNSYANAAPCYIPSERVLGEGGYEGGNAMVYYDQPTKLAPGLEEKIIGTVKHQFDGRFPAPVATDQAQGMRPLPAEQSAGLMKVPAGLAVELVAAEPLVASPVAVDFGPDGKLWVAEMYDYPSGLDGNFQPGGRVRLIESTRGDGNFDKATVFLSGIPFPTGITVWRNGVLVCAAPDILYAEDTNGDGKADVVKKLFSGFGTENYQARVNSLEYGLDGWVYGSCGLFGGKITSFAGGDPIALGDRDFRIQPDTGRIEAATGRTQQGRVRDDWDNWFCCNNGSLCFHHVIADHYLRRNPYAVPTAVTVWVPDGPGAGQLFPAKPDLQLFKLSGPSGRPTAACGLGIYRDDLLGGEFRGNTFTCEPVNLLVHRMQLTPKGSTFAGRRAAGEEQSEFLTSTDNWFRPVQARTGPDGGLWVVDMYRLVIEHPRWIPPQDLAHLDVRAGHNMGRIYRVRPKDRELRTWPRLDRLDPAGLVAALDSPNGWQRDMAMQMLVWRDDRTVVPALQKLARTASRPEARMQALCVLDQFKGLTVDLVKSSLASEHAGVRRHAVRVAESLVKTSEQDAADLIPSILERIRDDDAQVRLQVAYSLGEWPASLAGQGLPELMVRNHADPYLLVAALSSMNSKNVDQIVSTLLAIDAKNAVPAGVLQRVLSNAVPLGDDRTVSAILSALSSHAQNGGGDWVWRTLSDVISASERKGVPLVKQADAETRQTFEFLLSKARKNAANESLAESERVAAIGVLGRSRSTFDDDLQTLQSSIGPRNSAAVQSAATAALARIADDRVPPLLLGGWRSHSPALKSQALDVLLGREAWARLLLARIEAGDVSPTDIDPTRRQRLLAHRSQSVREQAARLLAGAINADRQKVLDDHRDVLSLKGDRERGRAVFTKTCSVCHRLEEVGHIVGPDLGALANKTPQFLLQEILDPNRNMDSRFVAYVAATQAGRTISGLLAGETANAITLRGQEGKEETLLRSDIEELAGTGKSLMPEGLEKDLSKQNLADLIAYLTDARGTPKSFIGNQPVVVKPAENTLVLLATTAEIYGDQILFELTHWNIGYWHSPGDHVVWTVELPQAMEFDVWIDWSCDNVSEGNAFAFTGGDPLLTGTVRRTGNWSNFKQEKIGTVKLAAGTHRLKLQPTGERINGALMDLRGVHLVPPGQPLTFAAVQPAARQNDVREIAAGILDDSKPQADRESLIAAHGDKAAELIAAMTADMPADAAEEYRRIPWIWRVAIAAGRKNDADLLRKILEVSLPKPGDPLRDWQAVVVGGGIINGISQQNVWPRARMQELIGKQGDLARRWEQTLTQSYVMADNERVNTGTRYDALRIIPLDTWAKCEKPLRKYLAPRIHDELQMGAISGLSDVQSPEVGELLVNGIAHFSAANRKLAIAALVRTEERISALAAAIEQGKIQPAEIAEPELAALRKVTDESLKKRLQKALGGRL
jgi:putative membrane-bound dehydrogenase-like protein